MFDDDDVVVTVGVVVVVVAIVVVDVFVVEVALYYSVGTPEAHVAVFVGVATEGHGHLKEERDIMFLLVCHLRLRQPMDDTAVGWLKPFYCHNTLPATA